ncbi:DUF6074 family protein [Devosia sp. XK-2]|uniref:DUF6074 family protein n=1 Tax=Devosia sp. XK-2 TaxID=3126689 RepID=UPI0030CEFAAA
MEYDPRQMDLFADAGGEGAAQRATKKRRSKPALPAPAPASKAPLESDAQQRPGRDGIILRFPTEQWAPRLWQPKVEKVSSLLQERKTERGRQNLWTTTVNTLFAQMRRRGATPDECQQQINDFHAAVAWQLSQQQSGPGAA